MRKFISLLAVLSLAVSAFTQTVIAADYDEEENEGEVFLSLTKTAEPLSDLTTNLTVITEEEIKEKSAETLGDIIEGELGIAYKNNGPLGQTQSVFMRGATSSQTLVLVDGRNVNDASLGGADFTAIPASMIERVEIIRGSGAALYGTGAFGGVINVITKKATPLTPNVNPYFSYGTFNTINAGITGAYANDVVSILIAPSMLSSDGYRKNSFYDSKNIFGKIGVNITENSEIVLSGQAYNADIGNPGSLSSPSNTAKQFEDNNYLKLDYNTKIEDFDIQVSGYNANYTRKAGDMGAISYDYITGDPYPNPYFSKYNTVNTGVKGNVTYKEMLTLGLEWDKTEFKQKDLLTDVETMNRNRENSAAYLQAFLTFGDLTLIPVVRGDLNTDYEDVFTPALSAVYKLTDEIKLSGNVSKVFRAPSFNDLYYPTDSWGMSGNPNLKPEKGWSYDLGIEYSVNKFTAMVTGFYIDSQDLIVWGMSPDNIGKAKQYGYEVGAKYDMCKEISHKINYTYTRAEDTEAHQDIAYIPMHNLNYAIVVKPIKELKISADVSYVTTTKASAYDAVDYLDDYCIVNARVDYQIMKYVSLWVKGNNLTNNDDYQLSYGYPMPGITGTAGIDVRF
ncbi:MAG: TonB-dependent receptor [Elusimicrobia bacterium]|nr:TonB-dependent receptor [Elusimicrobiota bacterium]